MKFGFSRLVIFLVLFLISNTGQTQKAYPLNSISIPEIKEYSNLASIGPFEISDADNKSKIRFQFAGQLWLMFESCDSDSNSDRTQELFMKARRIRLTIKGTVYEPNLSYKLHLSTAPKSLELMDFYFNYKINRQYQFRFGQYKTPFTRYRIQSFQRLAFIDWAITTKYFGAERQMGLAFHNGYENSSIWNYVLGIFTGVNARESHAIGLSKVYGEETINPSDLADSGPGAKFHPELFFHLTHNANDIQILSNSDAERTGFRYNAGISAAWDIDPTAYQDFRFRFASELLLKYRGVSLFADGYAGYSDIGNPVKTKLAMVGSLFQISYRTSKTYEVSIRYSIINFEDALTNDAYERAQQLIADSGDDPDVIKQYCNAGSIVREQEMALGLNIYIIGHTLKLQNDISWLCHSLENKHKDDFLVRSQFQLTF